VALGSGSTTDTVVGTAGATINGTSYGFAGTSPTSTVSVGAAGSERTITNVAAGRIDASSTDAINGSQLFAANQAIGTVGTQLSNLGYSVASGLGGNSSYDPVTGTLSASFTYGGGTYSSVQSVFNQIGGVVNGGGIKYFHASSNLADSQAVGTDSVAVGPQAVANDANSVAIGNGAKASGGSVALGAGSVTGSAVPTAGATIAGTAYSFAGATPGSVVSVGAPGAERQISHVAAGQLSAASTDAVNGSQLYATNQAVGSLDAKVTRIGDQVGTIDGRVTNIENEVGAAGTTINNLQRGQDGMFQVSPDNTAKPTATGTNSAAGGAGAVASGSNSTAVGNGSQAVAANSVAVGQGSVAKRANSVSVGAAGSERQVTDVAAGTAATDAVNVSQLQASQAGNVQYDKNADGSVNNRSVTMNPGGDPTVIHNLGRGVANTDAVNVGQLTDGINRAVDWSKSYTDQRFNTLDGQLNTIGNRANGGIASAMAMASLPQAYQPNQNSAAVALGNFHGETGIAIGLSTITESGRYVFKVNATTNTRGDAGVGVGAAMVW
jgi:Autotransporter adhesin